MHADWVSCLLVMTTTLVTGTGRRSSSLQPELQVTAKATSSESMNSPVDKFPTFSEEQLHSVSADLSDSDVRYHHHHHPYQQPPNHPPYKFQPNSSWEGRNVGTSSWEHTNGSIRVPRTRTRKSVSEAFSTIRRRDGSVSANAHELAQALKAPLSYRLVVSSKQYTPILWVCGIVYS